MKKVTNGKPEFTEAIECLRESGFRITRNRTHMVKILMQLDRPVTAEELRQRAGFGETDLVTVYRNLETFERAGFLQRLLMENGTQLFEMVAPGDHYHHLICRECHRVEPIDYCLAEELTRHARRRGFSDVSHTLEIFGLCPSCQEKKEAAVQAAHR